VFRNGVSMDLTDLLLADLRCAIEEFDSLKVPLPHAAERQLKTFDHT
jgi:hypothetical protein